MAEHDESQGQPRSSSTEAWSRRSLEEHAEVFLELLDLVEATGRHCVGKEGELESPNIAKRIGSQR